MYPATPRWTPCPPSGQPPRPSPTGASRSMCDVPGLHTVQKLPASHFAHLTRKQPPLSNPPPPPGRLVSSGASRAASSLLLFRKSGGPRHCGHPTHQSPLPESHPQEPRSPVYFSDSSPSSQPLRAPPRRLLSSARQQVTSVPRPLPASRILVSRPRPASSPRR